MTPHRLASLSLTIFACLGALLSAQPALACSVCYGDPNSAMSQGAQAGMLVLLGVVGVVLTGLASLFVFWMGRAAQLKAQLEAGEEASRAIPGASRTPFSNT